MNDSQFVKSFAIMIIGLMILAVVLFGIANNIGGKFAYRQDTSATTAKAVAERIQPVGHLAVATQVANALIPAAEASDKGKAVFDATCAACHMAGVAGAPKFGDKAAWAPRIAQGMDTLHQHALKGFQGKSGFMPAKGGNMSVPDDDVKAAVDYMVGAAK